MMPFQKKTGIEARLDERLIVGLVYRLKTAGGGADGCGSGSLFSLSTTELPSSLLLLMMTRHL
jgi:hypothetical protein